MSNNLMMPRRPLSVALNDPQIQASIHQALNDSAREKSFVASLIAASTINTALTECNVNSVLAVALIGESLKLCPSPQLGHYYFVPYECVVKRGGKPVTDENGRPVKEKRAQFQLGYKGYIQLALRSGYYRTITVLSIKEGELKRWDPLTETMDIQLIEDEEQREAAKTVGYYAAFEYLNGFRKALYWSRSKMERHALRYSKGYAAQKGYTFWEKDFDAMAYKTMLRQLISKWGIMSIDLQRAFDADVPDVIDEQTTPAPPAYPAMDDMAATPPVEPEIEEPVDQELNAPDPAQVSFHDL